MQDVSLTEQPSFARHDRVRDHTATAVTRRIDALTQARIHETVARGRDAIVQRITQLDEEWDVDRALMVNFAIAGAITSSVGATRYVNSPAFGPRRKGFLYFFGAQLAFLLLHGTAGWCPPLVVFRRLGFRTRIEIESERTLLLDALQHRSSAAVSVDGASQR